MSPRGADPTRSTRAIALITRRTDPRLLRGIDRWLARLLRLPLAHATLRAFVDRRVPGTTRHLAARKQWFETTARSVLSTSPDAAVYVLGAGLDDLGSRLQQAFPAADIHEFDRPGSMARKRAVHPEHPRFHDHDLSDDHPLPKADRPLLVLAEGLFMYLDDATLAQLLDQIRAAARDRLVLAFSFLDATRLRDPQSPVARLEQKLTSRGEPFRWSIEPAELNGWLARHGLPDAAITASPNDYGEACACVGMSQS